MKRFLSVLLMLSMCFSLICTVSFAADNAPQGFADIKDHWAKEDIEKMAAKGIIKGVSDTEFAPDKNITRAEFLTLIIRVLDCEIYNYTNAYPDVAATDWYAGVVQTAKNMSIIDPGMIPDNNFKPTQPINREEMTSLIARAYEYKARETTPKADISVFKDKDQISKWATSYVAGAYGLKIINGVTATTFEPASHATRAQAATIIRRFLANNKIGKTLSVLTIGNSFSVDGMQYLYGIAESYGYDNIILGIIYMGGAYLKDHHANINSGEYAYTYKKNTDGKWVDTPSVSMVYGLKDQEWDNVVIQQGSGDCASQTVSYNTYVNTIINYIKENCKNPKVKIGWHMAWAHQTGGKHYAFTGMYNSDQMTMYNSLVNDTRNIIAKKKEISFIIPSGTAIQNARTSFLGDNLTRDGYHLDEYVGRYIAALTWFCTVTGTPVEDIDYVPSPSIIIPDKRDVAVESAINAIAKPYTVTQSAYK